MGVSHYTKVIENSNGDVVFDQWFEWPVGSPVQSHEVLEIVLLNYNKYFTNKIVGSYGLVLQKLIEDGHLRVADSLVDINNMPTEIVLLFDVRYNAPDGSVGEWSSSAMQGESFEDDRQALIVIERNIVNLERSISNRQQQQQQGVPEVDYHLPTRTSGSALSLISPRSPERKR
ncbi:otoferlin-like [Stegodyphus dumicola]|nr:otoferlin-like [Stegodyphus dumicola]